jgi:hypothetical protein
MQPSPTDARRRRASGALVPLVLVVSALVGAACGSSAAAPPARPSWILAFPGNGGASVSWGKPAVHADVTSYVATALPGGHTCSSAASSCMLAGLTNGQVYTVSVRAVGAGGSSAPRTASVTVGIPWPPVAPVAAAGDASATVTWKAPIYTNAPITSYQVQTFPAGGTCVTSATSCTVTGLTNGSAYSFMVTAKNANGASGPSARSQEITPGNTAGGSAGITYLGPVNAHQETASGAVLERDAGISVALPNGRDLWIFGDTSSFSAASSSSSAFIGGSTAAKGKYVPGKTPSALKDVQAAGATPTTPSQFIPTPTDTVMPDGSGRACTPANGAIYSARWPTGAALLDDPKQLLVTYTDVCVTSTTSFTVEGWGFMIYSWRNAKIKAGPYDVFPPAQNGAPLSPDRSYQSPIVSKGQITLFTSQCASLFIACNSGSVSATTIPDNPLAMAVPASYVAQPAVTDGATAWKPVNVSVAAYPTGLRLIEQTSIGGTFIVFSATSPTGPWHAFYSGTLPGCSSTPKGFCYAFVGHPELGNNSTLTVSYFKPDSPQNANVGHVDLAAVTLLPA